MSDDKQMSDVEFVKEMREYANARMGRDTIAEDMHEALDRLERLRGEFNGALDTIGTKDMRIAALEAENAELRAPDGGVGVQAWRSCYVKLRSETDELRTQIASLTPICKSSPVK